LISNKGGEKLMEQHITLNITAKNNYLEVIKEHFPQCFDRFGNFDIEKFKKELHPQEVVFSKESYGLDWLGKSYARLLATDSATTLLKEDKEWNNKEENKNSQNFLIRGDNLEVLKHLSNAYYKKIKMIYIDPPYNTGNDGFVYQDNRKFTVEEFSRLAGVDEEKAKRVLDFVNSKSNSHSAWLTFMYPRLYIARQLLRDDGVIFISIDDNEVSQLRILMDEIFGEENFVQNIIWQKKKGGSQDSQDLAKEHEYILMYQKSDKWRIIDETENYDEKEFNKIINGRKAKLIKLEKWGNHSLRSDRPTLYYPIKDPNGNDFYPVAPNGQDGCWRKKPETLDQDHIFWQFDSKGRMTPYEVIYLDEVKYKQKIIKTRTIFTDYGTTTDAVKEIQILFENQKIFDTPKPKNLIKKLLTLTTVGDDIILDFFAGSGTTGDAVMQLNAEDGGNRRYILVQLPEPIDPKKNKAAYDFVKNELGVENPTIFEITKERLIRAAKKIKEEIIEKKIIEKEKEIEEIKARLDIENKEEEISNLKEEINLLKNQDLGFKVFETIPIWEDYDFKAESFENQITFFDAAKLKVEDIQVLLTTWKTYDGVPLTEDLKAVDLDGYIGYYYDTKLYLMFKGFETKHLKKLLEEIDENKEFNPATIVIFGYNFESKTMREIKENVSSYANKKSFNIDVVIRY
jgi:adenine-specific DNA-methyltransferase